LFTSWDKYTEIWGALQEYGAALAVKASLQERKAKNIGILTTDSTDKTDKI
jgi:hypothetical protein